MRCVRTHATSNVTGIVSPPMTLIVTGFGPLTVQLLATWPSTMLRLPGTILVSFTVPLIPTGCDPSQRPST